MDHHGWTIGLSDIHTFEFVSMVSENISRIFF